MSGNTGEETSLDSRVMAHAVLAGLSSAIPIPILDDAVKDRIQRRMVSELAAEQALELSPDQVILLADDKSAFVTGAVKSLALWPLKKALQKTFFVLGARRVVALASECYQRGLLLEHVFRAGSCAPQGRHSPATVRAAIDEVLDEVRGGPIERALVAGFGESRTLVTEGLEHLWAKVRRWRSPASDDAADRAVDDVAEASAPSVAGIVDRLQASMSEVGSEHFVDLFRRLDSRLDSRPTASGREPSV